MTGDDASDERRVVMVAAYARNRVIGDHGEIPWRIPEDFAHFKRVTIGHTLVMGRATYDSIGRPLPGRTTIVVTRDRDWTAGEYADRVLVAHRLEEALDLAATQQGDTVIAGGTQIYAQAMPLATHQILTEIALEPDGDARFPEIPSAEWGEVDRVPGPGLDWVWWERISAPPTLEVAAVAFVRDGQVLTVRKRGTSRFMLVGGKLDPGETPADAACREAEEEVGLQPRQLEPLGTFLALAANEPGHLVRSVAFLTVPEGEPQVAAEIEEMRWMGLDDRHDDLAPLLEHHVLPLLRQRFPR
ncbi:MAG: dihydrofolate reductase [Nocardioides sp.]|nr:dihydrofolate reductase [Nocardioides sp.]